MSLPIPRVEKIGIIYIFKVKHSSRGWYVTLPIELVRQYGLNTGQVLKIHIKEVRKPRLEHEAEK